MLNKLAYELLHLTPAGVICLGLFLAAIVYIWYEIGRPRK